MSHMVNTDPTYKEWKLGAISNTETWGLTHTDPTYKEWKPTNTLICSSVCTYTDPTYKEWKHR